MASYKILSFDPGLTTLGYASSVYDLNKNILTVNRFGTFKATKQAMKEKEQSATYGYRLIALNILEDEIRRLIELFKPDYIASEDVFCQPTHVNAFAALTLCLHAIKHAAFMKNKTIYTMAPCDIKKILTDHGHADKEAMQKAVLTNKLIKVEEAKTVSIVKMCEHEADAIAVGFGFANAILPNLLIANKIKEDTPIELPVKEKKERKVRTKRVKK